MKMRIGSGPNTYEWLDNWAQVPNSEGARLGWAHHGLAITESGEVVAFHPSDPSVLVFGQDGKLKRSSIGAAYRFCTESLYTRIDSFINFKMRPINYTKTWNVFVSGDFAYVAAGSGGLLVVDLGAAFNYP